jgi:hypothetical protein
MTAALFKGLAFFFSNFVLLQRIIETALQSFFNLLCEEMRLGTN